MNVNSKVFIFGSRNITNGLNLSILSKIIDVKAKVLIGDCKELDTSMQQYFKDNNYTNINIYYSGKICRNSVGNWPKNSIYSSYPAGTKGFYTDKDITMCLDCTNAIAFWDGKSFGSYNNILKLKTLNKLVAIYVNNEIKVM